MVRLSVVMVTRDDARRIERALMSVRDHVDEIVVLDLGSVDGTVDRARRLGARVVDAEWSPDRAAVRNAALDASGADWNLVLEAGEWIDGGGAALEAVRDRSAGGVGLVEVVPGPASRGLAPSSLEPRLLPAGTRYGGGHREQPLVEGSERFRVEGLVVAADDADPARWRQDRPRVEAVLLQALVHMPDDPRLLGQLADMLCDLGRRDEACEVYVEALVHTPEESPNRHRLVVDTLDSLRKARRFKEAITLMDAEMPRWSTSPDFSFTLGDLFFEMILADPHTSPQLAPLAETSWRRCLEIGDRPELPDTLIGRGSFLAAQSLGTLALVLGAEEAAREWWRAADRLRLVEGGRRTARLPQA